ncbi:MAG: hypothetical protein IJF23_02470 [Clostridia bacterium]|nr:hypothetical protein [Clostridia bacterium]
MKEYDRNQERTGIQEAAAYSSEFDVQCDFVMVYGVNDIKKRVKKWKEKGYVIHLMTGVSWGSYNDYLFGKFDGIDHTDEGQRKKDSEIKHGGNIPYMVPSNSFAHFLAEKLKGAIDAGVEAIHLEEPEFWVEAGYSEAFKREWQIYYKEPWQDPQSSCDAQYRASKLKQYLYTRTLDRLCSELKEYAMVKYGRLLRFYVPTHSLINYSQWKIISPESALIDLPTIDGYIAQIWTGTSRPPNYYRGVKKERTFETAFLEYGVMQELVRGTGRKMWFLADPIEDDQRHTWQDYRENYYKTVVASLFHPEVSSYEVCPWPRRVMQGKHIENEETARKIDVQKKKWIEDGNDIKDFTIPDELMIKIPPEYKTNLLTVMHTLRDMADQPDSEWITKTPEVGLLMADSAMFQRICPEDGGDDSLEFTSFYGLSLPLLKSGIAVRPVQLDNIRRFATYLDGYSVLVLSYEYMKPSSPDINQAIAGWVKNGGTLVYVGDGSDPFNKVREWWNDGQNEYDSPAEHLFEVLGIGKEANGGRYGVEKGKVLIIGKQPKALATEPELCDEYRNSVLDLVHAESSSKFALRRGAYYVTSVLDEGNEGSFKLDGLFIDMFDSHLRTVKDPEIKAGEIGLWYDVSKIDKTRGSELIALSARAKKIIRSSRSIRFTAEGPSEMTAACRVWTKRAPKKITATEGKQTEELVFEYDPESETTYFAFRSNAKPVKITVSF